MLKKNIGTEGRLLRFAIACILLLVAVWYKSWILLIFAIFTFFEAIMSWCVMYQLLGRNSCPIEQKNKKERK